MVQQIISNLLSGTESVYFDVDGTLIHQDGSLTQLGMSIIESRYVINIATFGGWSKEMLQEKGFIINEFLAYGDLIKLGYVSEDWQFKRVPGLLVDNEQHQTNQILYAA